MLWVLERAKKLGLKVIDAKRPINVEVNSFDIAQSTRKNAKCCAFACAARKIQGVQKAYFFRSAAYLEFATKLVRYRLPGSIQKEIVSFDRGGGVAEGRYTLVPFAKTNGIGARTKQAPRDPKRSGKTVGRGTHRTAYVRTLAEPIDIPAGK